jgi:hypothetical protein
MMMTESEICYRYRINGCYGEKHISILAQLNACTNKEIDAILRKNGLIPKPKQYRKKPQPKCLTFVERELYDEICR